ncbi:MAG: GNAT family N-acetyltransferase [Alphaproteobacteria bacterium]|nr:GNAT family N-acetyltransferase [Alphaproteobacteria bacterium]
MLIRDARRADVVGIVRLLADDVLGRQRERLAEPLPEAYWRAFEAIERDPNNRLVVLDDQGTVVGCLQLTFIPGLSHQGAERAQIEGVRIAAGLRGQGAGKRLFEWAIAEARRHGSRMLQLTTDKSRTDAQRFYLELGFRQTHEGMKLDL